MTTSPMTAAFAGADPPTAERDERLRRAERRSAVAAAARAHSEAVAGHLDRLASRVRTAQPGVGSAVAPRLLELSTLLLADATPGALLRTVLELVAAAVPGADGVAVTLQRLGRIETAAASERAVAEADRAQYELRDGPCLRALDTGRSVLAAVLPDERWPVWGRQVAELGWGGALAVPLASRGEVFGSLNLYAHRAGVFDERSVVLTQALAEQVAVALTNAGDFRRQQDVAATLQRSLLPTAMPPVPGLDVSAVYRPATSGINVGGDWYDLLRLPDGRVALVVGDVGGHGLEAATTMGRLRTAVLAYALEGHPPARVLELVDTFLQQTDPEGYATCLVLVLDPGSGQLKWCNAGHPGPIVVTPPGAPGSEALARLLEEGGRVPALGAPMPPGSRADAGAAVLPTGSRLLLFTDGLVERRGESLDVGLARLDADAVARRDQPLEQWCQQVVGAQLDGREVDDDLAVLAVELTGRPPGTTLAGAGAGAAPPAGARVVL